MSEEKSGREIGRERHLNSHSRTTRPTQQYRYPYRAADPEGEDEACESGRAREKRETEDERRVRKAHCASARDEVNKREESRDAKRYEQNVLKLVGGRRGEKARGGGSRDERGKERKRQYLVREVIEDEREQEREGEEKERERDGEADVQICEREERAKRHFSEGSIERHTRAATARATARGEIRSNRHEGRGRERRAAGITTRAADDEALSGVEPRGDDAGEARDNRAEREEYGNRQ